jgi:hypothetical protein
VGPDNYLLVRRRVRLRHTAVGKRKIMYGQNRAQLACSPEHLHLLSILLSSGRKANDIVVALLIRLAQLRLKVLFDHDLKIKDVMKLGKIYDSIQTTMLLLLEFLSSPRDWKESEAEEFLITYASNIPPLDSLLDRKVGYGIDSFAAFGIVRPWLVMCAFIQLFDFSSSHNCIMVWIVLLSKKKKSTLVYAQH